MKNPASLLVAAFSGEKETPPAPAMPTMRTIAQGEVVGLTAENGAHVWRGIPYAASTAGENRWRAPQPAPAWEGRREALEFAERCAQLTNEFDQANPDEPISTDNDGAHARGRVSRPTKTGGTR